MIDPLDPTDIDLIEIAFRDLTEQAQRVCDRMSPDTDDRRLYQHQIHAVRIRREEIIQKLRLQVIQGQLIQNQINALSPKIKA